MNTDKQRLFSITHYALRITHFRSSSVSVCVYLWTISLLCAFAPLRETNAQVRPVYDYGATGLAQILKKLNTTASVMHIGAHPDDEDSGLLAYLARGENARTAYLSLTRGDGGQNIIGSEQSESLGVIRTEELLQARRLDGAEQYFTRAFDFGFSKTLAEAKEKWDEKVILCDSVRAIRAFRPLVVIARFTGTPADGHGHHQFAGYIAPLAVKAAADSQQCVDAGAPWQVLKFYVEQSFGDNSQPTLRINTGKYDSLLGRSYFEIAMEGRSQHKSQGEGRLELKGDIFSGLNLIESKVPKVENEKSVFDGIDTSIKGIAAASNNQSELLPKKLAELEDLTSSVLQNYEASSPQKIAKTLAQGVKFSYDTKWSDRNPVTKFFLENKEKEFSEALKLALGIQIDALANKETIVQGEDFSATVKVFFPNAENVKVKEITLNTPKDWQTTKAEFPQTETAVSFRREIANAAALFNVKPTSAAKIGGVYWLDDERDGNMYRWNDDENQTLPFRPPQVSAAVKIEIAGNAEIVINQPVEYRFADDVRGEIRRDLELVPDLSVSVDQKLLIVPYSEKPQAQRLVMNITKHSEKPLEPSWASLNLGSFSDWKEVPRMPVLKLKNKGEKQSIPFEFTIPARTKTGTYYINPHVAFREGMTYTEMHTIAYPHIQTHRFYSRVQTKLQILDLKVAPVKVGYVMGSGDAVPEAIRQMGLSVELLDETALTSGDLSRFDVIVAGIRAFQVRQDLVSNNQRILDFVTNGGTFIAQYQRPDYAQKNLAPFPANMNDTQKTTAGTTARVVDENAKVTILEPQSPVFNFPNKITGEDFAGWVQERNLYNFTTFDRKYTPLLESHDAGEQENKGGMVYAELGKGKYIYTSYSFFRQLPAGIPGAYRLFANLLSLPKAKK
ncbi:MAG: PIG-L family deacetylase [Pyrinomonadaceae bacterium]